MYGKAIFFPVWRFITGDFAIKNGTSSCCDTPPPAAKTHSIPAISGSANQGTSAFRGRRRHAGDRLPHPSRQMFRQGNCRYRPAFPVRWCKPLTQCPLQDSPIGRRDGNHPPLCSAPSCGRSLFHAAAAKSRQLCRDRWVWSAGSPSACPPRKPTRPWG